MKYFWLLAISTFFLPKAIKAQEDKLTQVPDVEFAEKTEKTLFYDWRGAKTNYKWDWLETAKDDADIYRYFTPKNDLMVVQKTEGTTWTQTDLPYAPFPPFWFYEATFHNVNGESKSASTGLLLKATSNKEEIKIVFTVDPYKQTYYFGLYNASSKTWKTLNKILKPGQFNFSDAIQKLEEPKESVRNKLKIQRSGNNFLLYINFKLVETVKVPLPTSELNKLHGIGIASGGKQGYYIDDIRFSIFTDEGIYNNKESGKPALGQPISKALSKKVPAKISGNISFSLVHNLDANGIQRAKNAMVGINKFSQKEFDIIVSRANIKNYPEEINTLDKIQNFNNDHIEKGQFYIQGSFLLPFNEGAQIVDLVWMPASDNSNLEKTLLPADGGDQFYFITHSGTISKKEDHYISPSVPVRMSSGAEQAMKQKHSKSIVESPVGSILVHYDGFHAYKSLRSLGYTEEEFVRIMQLSTYRECKPTGLIDINEIQNGLYTKYKAYRITEFNDGGADVRLYWVPKEENLDLPKTMHPLTDEGVFLFTYVRSTGIISEMLRKNLVNKPTGQYVYPKPTEYTIAKTSNGVGNNGNNNNNGSNGGNNGVQKTKKPTQPEYGKYSPDDVYKEEEKLINYLKYNDSQLNPYLDKILRSGKDAWILYKTKESARNLVDGQINAINAFLKDYGRYTTSSFKSDIEGRLATAIGVRGRLN
jgi:hypothetical protein